MLAAIEHRLSNASMSRCAGRERVWLRPSAGTWFLTGDLHLIRLTRIYSSIMKALYDAVSASEVSLGPGGLSADYRIRKPAIDVKVATGHA